MAKKELHRQHNELTPVERLGLRVSAMIQAPRSQADRRVVIHRLDTDPEEAWLAVVDLLRDTDGIQAVLDCDKEEVTVSWLQAFCESEADCGLSEVETEEPSPF